VSETQTPVDEGLLREFREMQRKLADISNAAVSGNTLSTGDLIASAAAVRTGALLCDGTAVSRTDYAALFVVIGVTYGVGDGSTTFTLPNYQGYAIGGVGGALGSLGVPVGAATVTLTAAQSGQPGIAAGTSGAPSTPSTGAGTSHTHGVGAGTQFVEIAGGAIGFATVAGALSITQSANTGAEAAHTHSMQAHTHTTPAVAAAPAASPHSVVQPTLPAFIHIKT
jgi:microcystin-dependent protein